MSKPSDRDLVRIALQIAIDTTTAEIEAAEGQPDEAGTVTALERRVAGFRRVLAKRYGEGAAVTPMERLGEPDGLRGIGVIQAAVQSKRTKGH
ncbi:hypothetical protein CKO28_00665 [Rhodovibrio sodomensis]|uniref:Uncharacterized protein n=1 Tax=Rhodovibrio sodomensis TaxID=1088 RepID=A0ABS1D7Z7_9PROT|nr:hypothetical protein [Rhodovibrio sodomensis]MBK1666553.1 hypothetical protein [Rhodovibrio sodomensis]